MNFDGITRFIRAIIHADFALGEQDVTQKTLSLQITGAACIGNTLVGIGKLIIGIISLSIFTCVSAFYTFGMVFAKYCAFAGILKTKDKNAQYRYYVLSGIVLIGVSILYILYSVRLFFYPIVTSYHMYVGIGIATFTFTELTLNIRGVIIERHNHTPLIHAIKMINLASSLICLVLTQTALLSFADMNNTAIHSNVNGLMGIIMGSLAVIIGVIMIIRIKQIQRGKNYGRYYLKIKKLIKKQQLSVRIKPILLIENENKGNTLYVIFFNASQEHILKLQTSAMEQLELNLLDEKNMIGVILK